MKFATLVSLLSCLLVLQIAGHAQTSASMDLSAAPLLKFTGLRQTDAPQPLWTIAVRPALAFDPDGVHPAISVDGRWLALSEESDFRHPGSWLGLVDLENRQMIKDVLIKPTFFVGHPVFDRSRQDLLRAVVNTSNECALANWTVPDLEATFLKLDFGKAISATFAHQQDKAVIMREDGVLGVFDTAMGNKLLEVDFYKDQKIRPKGIALSRDDDIVTMGLSGYQLCRWKLADGTRLDSPLICDYLPWGIQAEYSQGNTKLITSAQFFNILDAQQGTPLDMYPAESRNAFSYHAGLNLAATSTGGDSFGVVDVNTGKLVMWVPQAADWSCFSPDGRTLYTSQHSGIMAWDLAAERANPTDWLFGGQQVIDIALSSDGERLSALGTLVLGFDKPTRVDTWSLKTRDLLGTRQLSQLRRICDNGKDSDSIWKLLARYAVDGNIFAILYNRHSKRVEVLNTAKGEIVLQLGVPEQEAWSDLQANFHPGATREEAEQALVAASTQVFPNETAVIPFTATASMDGTRLLVANPKSQGIRASLWSLETGKLLEVLGQGLLPACTAIFTGDEHKIVTGDEMGSITILDPTNGAVLQTIQGIQSQDFKGIYRNSTIRCLTCNNNGSMIYACDQAGSVVGWSLHDGNSDLLFKQTLPNHPGKIVLSPNGKLLAACSSQGNSEGQIIILNAETGSVLKVLDENATCVLFLSDDQLVTNGIRIWSLNL